MGRNLTLTETKNTFTRTHLQGDSTLCWLYFIASSLHQSMKLKAEKRFEISLMSLSSRPAFQNTFLAWSNKNCSEEISTPRALSPKSAKRNFVRSPSEVTAQGSWSNQLDSSLGWHSSVSWLFEERTRIGETSDDSKIYETDKKGSI